LYTLPLGKGGLASQKKMRHNPLEIETEVARKELSIARNSLLNHRVKTSKT
jgi:hypothetical protein